MYAGKHNNVAPFIGSLDWKSTNGYSKKWSPRHCSTGSPLNGRWNTRPEICPSKIQRPWGSDRIAAGSPPGRDIHFYVVKRGLFFNSRTLFSKTFQNFSTFTYFFQMRCPFPPCKKGSFCKFRIFCSTLIHFCTFLFKLKTFATDRDVHFFLVKKDLSSNSASFLNGLNVQIRSPPDHRRVAISVFRL